MKRPFKMIRFTIITCTYNAAGVLRRTLESVLCQTWLGVEHLIVDGASADDTLSVVAAYKNESDVVGTHSVRVLSEPDKGLYDAMNKGLVHASGDYVVFLNAGDFLPAADTLAVIAASAGDGDLPAVMYGDTDIVDYGGRFLRHRRLSPPVKLTWRSFRYGMLVCHQAFYVRRDIACAESYDLRWRYSADVDWCIRVMKRASAERLELRNVGAVVACYLDGGMSVDNHRESLCERFIVMRRHYGVVVTVAMHFWFVVRAVLHR